MISLLLFANQYSPLYKSTLHGTSNKLTLGLFQRTRYNILPCTIIHRAIFRNDSQLIRTIEYVVVRVGNISVG